MRKYDYEAAKKMIQMKSDVIVKASLGMEEDWFCTAVNVYEDEKFVINLDEEPEIAGIRGSFWATPSLMLYYKDGREELIECYTGDKTSERPEWFDLGVLSSPAQDYIEQVKTPKLSKE